MGDAMAELTPIVPSPVVHQVRKIDRDQERQRGKKQPENPQDEVADRQPPAEDDGPVPHIDEFV